MRRGDDTVAADCALVDTLVAHAFQAATAPPERRQGPREVSSQLGQLAGNDRRALLAAWDECVDRFADGEDLGWGVAATYFLRPLARSATLQSID